VILAEQNQTPHINSSRPKGQTIANQSKSRTTRRKFPTSSFSTSTGGKSIPRRPMASLPISARVIAPRFFTGTQRRRKSRRPQGKSSRIQANSINQSLRSEEHTSELQSRGHLVCRLLIEKKKNCNTHSLIYLGTG